MRRLLWLTLLLLGSHAYAQNCAQFPNSIICLPQVVTPTATDRIVDDQGANTTFNPGTATLAQISAWLLGPGAAWAGNTIGVPFGGTGVQNIAGPIKGNGSAPFSAAAASDITGLFGGVPSASCYLRGDGLCFAPPGSGTLNPSGSPVNGNLAAWTSPITLGVGTASTVTGTFGGSCNSSTFLRGDGNCATPAGAGTVTSVALTLPSWLTVSGSPITGAGTLAVTATGSLSGNQVLATPAGASGALNPRALVAGDIPVIPLATGVSGPLPIANTPIIPLATQTSGILTAVKGGTGVNNGANTLTISGGSATFAAPPSGQIGPLEVPPAQGGSPCINVNYPTILSDAGKMLCNASTTAVTFTISGALAYAVGTHLLFLNPCLVGGVTAGTLTIAITGATMSFIGSGSTTSRTLAPCGAAEAINYGSGVWMIGGTNLTMLLSPPLFGANDDPLSAAA